MVYHGAISLVSVDTVNEVATLAELKSAARVETPDEDSYLTLCLNYAKDWVEQYLARKLDDCTYEQSYRFERSPVDGDCLWLSPAPVGVVSFSGTTIPFTKTPNGWDSYVIWDSDLLNTNNDNELKLEVSAEWAEKLLEQKFKIPLLTVAATFYRYREFTLARATAVNNAIEKALISYRRGF